MNGFEDILYLLDSYFKANNNCLPLQAFLDYFENNSLDGFSAICNTKKAIQAADQVTQAKSLSSNNLASTLCLIDKLNESKLILAQKLYKIIISIEYSQYISSLSFIRTSLEQTFEKIIHEYNEFYAKCAHTEPQIYLTVILWNTSYLAVTSEKKVPFKILCHLKFLLKSNMQQMCDFVFESLKKYKQSFVENEKVSYTNIKENVENTDNTNNSNNMSPFDQMILNVVKIFKYAYVNDVSSTSATSLAMSHHIHITDGLIYTNDVVKLLEKISKSSISFSFIYSGNSSFKSGSNISSGLGYLADHYLMKFLSSITNGFYAVVDENLKLSFIHSKNVVKHFDLLNDLNQNEASTNEIQSNLFNLNVNLKSKSAYLNYTNKMRKRAWHGNATKLDQNKCILKYELCNDKIHLFQIVKLRLLDGFYLHKIEKNLTKSAKIKEIKLNKSAQSPIVHNSYLITLTFKRFFTQTTYFLYKISYYLHNAESNTTQAQSNEKSDLNMNSSVANEEITRSNPNTNEKGETPKNARIQNDTELKKKYTIEIWFQADFLKLKSKYQNSILAQKIKQTLNQIYKIDYSGTFSLNLSMFNPPEILKLKEPLFKLVLAKESSMSSSALQNDIHNIKYKDLFGVSSQNLSYELNIRSNKGMAQEIVEFSQAWLNLAFFKYSKAFLEKYFFLSTIKLILDYDRPIPDLNSVLFDIKNTFMLMALDIASNNVLQNNLIQDQLNNLGYLNNVKANVFNCQNSLNKLLSMLIDWCDVVLVENCVFLKYLTSSPYKLKGTADNLLSASEKIKLKQNTSKLSDDNVNQSGLSADTSTLNKANSSNDVSLTEMNEQNEQADTSSSRSFLVVRLDTSHIPYISIELIFHSSISYFDRVCFTEKFKENLKELNLKNLIASSVTPVNLSNKQNSYMLTNPSQQFLQQQVQLDGQLANKKSSEFFECCQLLQKPDLYDSLKSIFDESMLCLNADANKMLNEENEFISTNKSNQILDFFHKRKFKWTINKAFSYQTSLFLKEMIIDMFIRTRLKEGFKCLYKCSKFVVFTLQLSLFDAGGLSHQHPSKEFFKQQQAQHQANQQSTFKTGSSQCCSFIYVLHFNTVNNSGSNKHEPMFNLMNNDLTIDINLEETGLKRQGSENTAESTNTKSTKSSETVGADAIFFSTELYVESIDGICQRRKAHLNSNMTSNSNKPKERLHDYFRNLTNLEIINLIYLIDFKCFNCFQSIHALFLSESNALKNMNHFLGQSMTKFTNQNMNEYLFDFNFDSNYLDSIRILPDLSVLAFKSLNKLSQVSEHSSTPSQLHNPIYGFNRLCQVKCESPSSSLSLDSEKSTANKEHSNSKKRKTQNLSLSDQLKNVLDCIETSSESLTIDFSFSLRSILLNSSLYVCVFEDIPLNLFNKHQNVCSAQRESDMSSIQKVHEYFFECINEQFDLNLHHNSNEDVKDLNANVKKELKNSLMVKLNDIKTGDSITRQIIDDLWSQYNESIKLENGSDANERNFQYFLKFSINQETAMSSSSFAADSSNPKNDSSSTATPLSNVSNNNNNNNNNLGQQSTASTYKNYLSQSEIENNRFIIFGFFFLNQQTTCPLSTKSSSLPNERQTGKASSSSHPHRLVFFLYDCVPDSIKKSLINVESNTFLIRKALFQSDYKAMSKSNSSSSEKLAHNETYRFYSNKRINPAQNESSNMHKNTSHSVLSMAGNLVKKCFSIADILKYHCSMSYGSNQYFLLNYIDHIEEVCYKSYIRSLLRYLAFHSLKYKEMLAISNQNDSINESVKLESQSLNQLLKIGSKVKLVELDLTDYLKMVCSHVSDSNELQKDEAENKEVDSNEKSNNDETLNVQQRTSKFNWKKCDCKEKSKVDYLAKKFDEIFLRNFNLIPGSDDLFIFSSSHSNHAERATKSESIGKGMFSSAGMSESSFENEMDLLNDEESKKFYVASDDESDSDFTFDEDNEEMVEDDEIDVEEHERSTTDRRLNNESIDEEDDKFELKRGKNINSSPYSLSSMSKKVKNNLRNRFKKTYLAGSNQGANKPGKYRINEQLIGIEYVCIIGSTYVDENKHNERARTTTLTPDMNTETDEAITSSISNNNVFALSTMSSDHIGSTLTSDINLTDLSGLNNKSNSTYKQSVFYSKFNKFNLCCLLDLIHEKDLGEFKRILAQLESQQKFESSCATHDENGLFLIKDIKVLLRFNWYTFNECISSKSMFPSVHHHNDVEYMSTSSQYKSLNLLVESSNFQMNQGARPMKQPMMMNNEPMSSHSSSSTVYNKHLNKYEKTPKKFQYLHLISPKLNEFKWHLKDELFQMENGYLKNMRMFNMLMTHLKEGVKHNYKHCRFESKKIVLNKETVTTTTTVIDPKPLTNASFLSTSSTKTTDTKTVTRDKSIMHFPIKRFFVELTDCIKSLDRKFYECKLQQMKTDLIDSAFYSLNCFYSKKELSPLLSNGRFKILLHLQKQPNKVIKLNARTTQNSHLSSTNKTPSPTTGVGMRSPIESNIENTFKAKSQQMPLKKASIGQESSNKPLYQRQLSQKATCEVKHELKIDQILIRIYFGFDNSTFHSEETLINNIISEFNAEIDSLIKMVYLTLTLKEINETLKWNSLLNLKDNENDEHQLDNSQDLNMTMLLNEELGKHGNEPFYPTADQRGESNNAIVCNCVWFHYFKLHRLHQTTQKVHGATDLSSSTSSSLTLQQQQLQAQLGQPQHFISQGLRKLQEALVNFKIEDSNCGDLYIYTRQNEIYLLKLDEVCENRPNASQMNANINLVQSVYYNETFGNENSSESNNEKSKIQQQKINLLTRRPSYSSIADSDTTLINLAKPISTQMIKSQNLSGGSVSTLTNSLIASTNLPNTSVLNQQRTNPEYIKLSVFGLKEPGEEMKQDLIKTLQSELDYWLLIRMCNSIDKNTYKSTSAQHPDKITDDDLTFFKQIADNSFDYEIALPFVFNFSRTLRDNFLYFVKQVLNSNFKTIETPMNAENPFQQSASSKKSSVICLTNNSSMAQNDTIRKDVENEFDELNSLLLNEDVKFNYKPSSAKKEFTANTLTCHTPSSLNTFDPQNTSSTATATNFKKIRNEYDPNMILLNRILFHSSKNKGFGKPVSLVLVEALYSLKGLEYLVSSRIARSNSIGTSSNVQSVSFNRQNSQPQQKVSEKCHSAKQKQAGPTFVFRFYCRGENDTNVYKESLKSALNDALLHFLSEYLTKIEPEFYLKSVLLKKSPHLFRAYLQRDKVRNESEHLNNIRKRHKSMGTKWQSTEIDNNYKLVLNKTATQTKIGHILTEENIVDESQFNLFVLRNFKSNLFDPRDYQEVIQYFREPIRAFDYSKIFNNFVNKFNDEDDDDDDNGICNNEADYDNNEGGEYYEYEKLQSALVTNAEKKSLNEQVDQQSDIGEELINDEEEEKYDSVELEHSSRSFAESSESETSLVDNNEPSILNRTGKRTTYLRIIYEWLRGLYMIQMKSVSKSAGCLSSSQKFTATSQAAPHPQSIPSQTAQLQQQSTTVSSSAHMALASSYILRKKIFYYTKYNLINLVKDIENGFKDLCKCDFYTSFYSFEMGQQAQMNQPPMSRGNRSLNSDCVFLDEMRSTNFHSLDECDSDNDFKNLKQIEFSVLKEKLNKNESLIIVMNAEHSSTSSLNTNQANSVSYNRLPSFSNTINPGSYRNSVANEQINKPQAHTAPLTTSMNSSTSSTISSNNTANVNQMIKSTSSNSGESESMNIVPQLKKTFVYGIVNSRCKSITTYCFTTESSNYDSIKHMLDQLAEMISYRYYLLNNTVIYKFGGLIGDNLLLDLKKVKAATNQQLLDDDNQAASNETKNTAQKLLSSNSVSSMNNQAKMVSKSPTLHRQFSYKGNTSSANLQTTANVSNPQQNCNIKHLIMNQMNIKSYDSTINIVNNQINFCAQYMYNLSSAEMPSSNTNKMFNRFNTYGVGMNYQLLEMLQIYRNPRKIYELILNLANSNNSVTTNANNSTQPSSKNVTFTKATNTNIQGNQSNSSTGQSKNQIYINELYKNVVVPVLIPMHYCMTPLLFYPNWSEPIVTETMLRPSDALSQINKSNKTTAHVVHNVNFETWYFKMREMVLSEYAKYFELRGFIRLKDDLISKQNETLHFIMWIEQDGFLYLTLNIDEVFIHVRLGYSIRYRAGYKSFLNEMMRFFAKDFHVHSFIYDSHLSAINRNFSSHVTGSQVSQTSPIIVKFLDEFVDFYSQYPPYSSNKVFKLIYEKSDNSLIPHKFRFIFDVIIDSKKHANCNLSFQTIYIFDNNIAIYSLTENKNKPGQTSASLDHVKYLVVKIENYYNTSSKKSEKQADLKLKGNNSVVNLSKLSESSISLNSNNQESLLAEPFIRIICYYLYISKSKRVTDSAIMQSLNDDLITINKVIENSTNLYKQEIFWDNLSSSLSSIRTILNENSSTNSDNTPSIYSNFSIVFSVNSQELEQILSISNILNVLEFDSSLEKLLAQCYSIKEKIKTYLKFSFGRHFMFTASESIEYCLLLINDDLVKNFRFNSTSKSPSKSVSSSTCEQAYSKLNSFILLKFDNLKQKLHLLKISRINSNTVQQQQTAYESKKRLSITEQKNSTLDSSSNEALNSLDDPFSHLNFTVNTLLYILWESLFFTS
jgi:hypothetical protein